MYPEHLRMALGLKPDQREVEVTLPATYIEPWHGVDSRRPESLLNGARLLVTADQLPPMISSDGYTSLHHFRVALFMDRDAVARVAGVSANHVAKLEHPRFPAKEGERESVWIELASWAWRRARREDRVRAVREREYAERQEALALRRARRDAKRQVQLVKQHEDGRARILREQLAITANENFEQTAEFYRLAFTPWSKTGNPVALKEARKLLGIEDEAAS